MASGTSSENNYVQAHLPPAVIRKLESGAFQSLCAHLRERSNEVQNIDLMTVSGFCRNCLSKWLVVEARKLSDSIQKNNNNNNERHLVDALDAMGYDEAAQYVYGMTYPEWKKRHAQKASDAQMEKFNGSKPLWAAHDKQLLAKRRETAPGGSGSDAAPVCKLPNAASASVTATGTKPSLLSNVCCEDSDTIDAVARTTAAAAAARTPQAPPVSSSSSSSSSVANTRGGFVPPALPGDLSFSLGILTVSDRAASGEYATGDLSGPAVREAVETVIASNNNSNSNSNATILERIETAIVPDDGESIRQKLLEWTDNTSSSSSSSPARVDLVLTTGGTGFSPRDVTPEATDSVLEQSCGGLMAFCGLQTIGDQPLAALSRGTAGIRKGTLVANLPGNPGAVRELVPVLLPLALRAVADLKKAEQKS